jgi:Protein of unknown function (DUF3326)
MWVNEREFALAGVPQGGNWFDHVTKALNDILGDDELGLRFVVTECGPTRVSGEALILNRAHACGDLSPSKALRLVCREFENTSAFNAALVVPTGIGAEIGGHAGDAGPVVRLLASICDSVITHPNVVNASDINEMPHNALYVEGSILSRLLLGTIALQPVRNNRVLVVIDEHQDPYFTTAAINSVSAARATYGLDCPQVLRLDPRVRLKVAYSASGRATGEVTNFETLIATLRSMREQYDAIALSSVIDVPAGYHQAYFDAAGEMVNPWGGVEAMLTHTLSTLLDVPTAHSPMFEARDIANSDPGIVDPRLSAEATSLTFLQCILKGLQCSPRIVVQPQFGQRGLIDVTDVSCLVIPDGCIGIPTLAALAQGIPVIAVRENRNLMRNDLSLLPWKAGQFVTVENYWEAAGVIAAIKAGIEPRSVRRPFPFTKSMLAQTELTFQTVRSRAPLDSN